MQVFKPTRENLHSNILRRFEENLKWHIDHGYRKTGEIIIDEILKNYTGLTNGVFTILIEDGSEKYHGNSVILVFNNDGIQIDGRIYFNPIEGKKVPKKAFNGTPIIDGSKPIKFEPPRKIDKKDRQAVLSSD